MQSNPGTISDSSPAPSTLPPRGTKLGWREQQVRVGLSALKAVAVADGPLGTAERAMLTAMANFFGTTIEPDALPIATVAEAAAAFPELQHRRWLVQAQIAMATMPVTLSSATLAAVRQFNVDLGVNDPRVHHLDLVRRGRISAVKLLSIMRYPLIRIPFVNLWRESGFVGIWQVIRWFLGRQRDEDLAARYEALKHLPRGVLGREFWEHMRANKLCFPGERGGFPAHDRHDLAHVLTGYGTDHMGEMELACFQAGKLPSDPFAFVFSALLMVQLGVKFLPVAPAVRGEFDVGRALDAIGRGAEAQLDTTWGWDVWTNVNRPLDVLREEWGMQS